MDDDIPGPRVNVGYALAQLERVLAGGGVHSAERAAAWRRVIGGLLDGSLRVGSRTPVADAPPWVTLDVVHGGFATGNLAAGGPLQPHEVALLASVPRPDGIAARAALNLHYLGDDGRRELAAMLANGRFRVRVPEEGALLALAWLLERGEAERAADLLDALLPYFDRLRFYPAPQGSQVDHGLPGDLSHPRPVDAEAEPSVRTVGEVVASLEAVRLRPAVEQMNETIQVWTPLYDRAVALFLETVEGDPPALRTDASGALARAPNGQPIAEGGWPCRRYAPDWPARSRQVLADYDRAREQHGRWGKADKPKENFARLRGYLATAAADPRALSGRDVGMLRHILASYATRHGAPGSGRLAATRASQARAAARPAHASIARAVAERLASFPADEGLADPAPLTSGLSAAEAARLGAPVGSPLPPAVAAKALRCLAAPPETLVAQGLVASAEALAGLLPALTARARAEAISDPALRRLYRAEYTALRRRRSLLLLDLEAQVRLGELPWIAAVAPWVESVEVGRVAARAALERIVTLAVCEFPQTILSNRLVKELRTFAAGAGLALPLVDELAADIFMGAFSANFLRAAHVAARRLGGTLYARYYDLPIDQVLSLDDVAPARSGTPMSSGFARLCAARAGVADEGRWSVARNGAIIEQAQILTTHNLAVLFDRLDLAAPRPRLPALARACFAWICRRLGRRGNPWRAELHTAKDAAYAWRQMLCYLSLVGDAEVAAFLDWIDAPLGEQRADVRERLRPAVAGLRAIAAGDRFDAAGEHAPSGGRRVLGWTTGRHWLLPPAP